MNRLDYRTSEENGLSFELLVDGQPLGLLVGARDTIIPYWIIEDDLPYFPPNWKDHDPEIRIVTVCSCGDEGCGSTQCRVIREGDLVLFRDFDYDASAEGAKKVFRFSRHNYDAVVAEIVRQAKEYTTNRDP